MYEQPITRIRIIIGLRDNVMYAHAEAHGCGKKAHGFCEVLGRKVQHEYLDAFVLVG